MANWISSTGRISLAAIITMMVVVVMSPAVTHAATNQGTGDIAGVGGDLTDSNVFNLSATTLAVVKTAFLTDGTELSDSDTVASGTLVQFMIFIDNTTDAAVADVSVSDILNVAFTYQTGTIKVDNSVATGGSNAAIYAAVDAVGALTDAVDGDAASITGTTIDAGNENVANSTVSIAANTVWAILFTVQM